MALLWVSTALAQSVDPATGLQIAQLPMTLPNGEPGISNLTDFRFLPDGRMVITEKGLVDNTGSTTARVFLRDTAGQLSVAWRFCVATTSEQGLLGVEVDPDFNNTQRLFFYYSNCPGDGGTNTDRHRVVSFTLQANGTLDPASEKILVRNLRGPANHDGGSLAIGPDGKLYIGVGDTGCNATCCPANNVFASCLTVGNGKILRINLDGSIPSDNPLVDALGMPKMVTACGSTCTSAIDPAVTAPARSEIWAWGFRNPFRIWADPKTGLIWVGDVGETIREEVTIAQMGHHHGYPWQEGTNICSNASSNAEGDTCWADAGTCDYYTPGSGPCVPPEWDCDHSMTGCQSITGGLIIDTCSWPAQVRGNYFFGDNAQGALWMIPVNATRTGVATPGFQGNTNAATIFGNVAVPVAFHMGLDGNLYVADLVNARDPRHLSGDAGDVPRRRRRRRRHRRWSGRRWRYGRRHRRRHRRWRRLRRWNGRRRGDRRRQRHGRRYRRRHGRRHRHWRRWNAVRRRSSGDHPRCGRQPPGRSRRRHSAEQRLQPLQVVSRPERHAREDALHAVRRLGVFDDGQRRARPALPRRALGRQPRRARHRLVVPALPLEPGVGEGRHDASQRYGVRRGRHGRRHLRRLPPLAQRARRRRRRADLQRADLLEP
ncbi:MAG: PQQ-dependent sugar dehydrogenase [Myxococcaceae bacterium]